MAPPYHLITLGTLQVAESDWNPAKALTLLVYLNLQGPTSRRRLRELFWPEARDPGASLRVLLGSFRQQLPGCIAGEETLEAHVISDAARLLGLQPTGPGMMAADLYQGPFLDGTELNEVSAELEEWVLETRERLAGAARLASVRAGELAGSPAEAGAWADRAVSIREAAPAEPDLLERLLRLALPGSLLEAELRRELEELSDKATVAPPGDQELLGRERELDDLLLALTDTAVRLIEITGEGGIGKSTLAAALLREQKDLTGVQVLSVALDNATAASEAAARMVVALGLRVVDRGDGWQALTDAWGERPLLVLLDGAEGLTELQRGIGTLLTGCPHVRVVVTSRVQRLEHALHLSLDGLSVPAPGDSAARVARSAAARLFVRGVRRYLPRFALDEQTAPLVSAIVRRLDGHPLATVLSATWMRVYPPGQIHTLILQDLASLRAEDGHSDRHRLSAVFERSWQLLTPEEAQAISALSVFQGFTPAAAEAVAGVTPELLARLKTHSLLRTLPASSDPEDRLEVPPVLAAQAQAHLSDAAAVQDAHAAYYLNHLMAHRPESDAVNTERANIVAALGYSVSQGQEVAAQIDALLASYDRRGLLDSGFDAFSMLEEALPVGTSLPASAGSLKVGLAWLAWLSSRRSAAERLAASILDAGDTYSLEAQMKASNIMASSLMHRTHIAESLQFYERALGLARVLGDRNREIMYSLNISVFRGRLGEYAQALAVVEEVARRDPAALSTEMRQLVEGQLISIRYYSAEVDESVLSGRFEAYLEHFLAYRKSRPYLVTSVLYIAFLLDHQRLPEAESQIRSLDQTLHTMDLGDLTMANRIAEIRLLYLQHRHGRARSMALTVLARVRSVNAEDGLCELLLACAPDLLEHSRALGVTALRMVTSVLSHSRFQATRAERLLTDAGVSGAAESTPPGLEAVLDEIKTVLGSPPIPNGRIDR